MAELSPTKLAEKQLMQKQLNYVLGHVALISQLYCIDPHIHFNAIMMLFFVNSVTDTVGKKSIEHCSQKTYF